MKFIHIADMHLDRAFEGLGPLPDFLVTQLVQQNKEILRALVTCAIQQEVDFVLIVGDTFHQPQVTIQTQHFFMQEMLKLKENDIPVILSFGNHDYYLKEKYWFDFLSNVIVFDSEEVNTVFLETKKSERVALSGFSYTNRWLNHSKVAEYPSRQLNCEYHLGFYHGEQGQLNPSSQSYGPFQIKEMQAKNYDYWALGHIHQPTVLSENPPIIYSGTPVGHTKKECDSQGFVLVTLEKSGIVYQWSQLNLVKWQTLSINCVDLTTIRDLLTLLQRELAQLNDKEASISLLQLELKQTSTELVKELVREGAKEELLSYLQEQTNSQTKKWPYQLNYHLETKEITLPFGVSQELLTQLGKPYLDEANFEQIISELYRQRELVKLLPNHELFRHEHLSKAQQLVWQALSSESGEN